MALPPKLTCNPLAPYKTPQLHAAFFLSLKTGARAIKSVFSGAGSSLRDALFRSYTQESGALRMGEQ